MAKNDNLGDYLNSLGQKIASKLNLPSGDIINPQDFESKIDKIAESGGGGYTQEDLDNAFADGKQAEWSELWDNLQDNGLKTDYSGYFGSAFNDVTFKPKHNMFLSKCGQMFGSTNITDLKGILENLNIIIDFSDVTLLDYVCQNSTITKFPKINSVKPTRYHLTFYNCPDLQSVEINSVSTTIYTQTFDKDTALTDLKITGEIGRTLSIQYSPLSLDSMENVKNALSTTASGLTVTWNKTAVNNAFGVNVDDESTYTEEFNEWRNSRSNWTFAYA